MAYAAVMYLSQLLEQELLPFLCRALEFEESKVKDFHLRVHNVLLKLNSRQCISHSHLSELQTYFQLLEPTIVDVVLIDEDALFDKVLLSDRNVLDRIPQLMDTLDFISCRLKNLRDSQVLSFRDFANSLISLNQEYRKVLSLLNQVAEEAISLLVSLEALALNLKNFDHLDVNRVQSVLGRAEYHIESFLIGYPFSLEKIDVVALSEVKQIIYSLRDTVRLFVELQSEPESSSRSQQRKHLLRMRAVYEDDKLTKSRKSSPRSILQIESPRESSPKREEILIGFHDDIAKIVDELTRPSCRLSIVTIAGMGGCGKTTLAKQVFQHPSIFYHFHFVAWVGSISRPDQVLSHLLQSIARSRDEIQGQDGEEDNETSSDDIRDQSSEDKGQILWRSLRKRKYLIIVDDLWDFDAWNAMERYFPDDNLGSRILVTSRFTAFPSDIPKSHLHYMELLDEERSWELLEKLVFGVENCPSELKGMGMLMARKCMGLRLAIFVIAGILLSIPRSYSSWLSFEGSINTMLLENQDIIRSSSKDSINTIVIDNPEQCVSPKAFSNPEQCLDILALSYKYLPHHLRDCFLFVGSFPANCEIDAQKLINLWIAEGFLDTKSPNSPEGVAESYLEELVRRCLLVVGQRSFDGKIKTCFIHELLRQLCLREAYRENFMQVFPGEATEMDLEERRHLIFNSINDEDLRLLLPTLHPRSFILHVPGFDLPQDMLFAQLSQYTWLRVLDIYFLPLDCFPMAILDLVNLRYLAFCITYLLDASISQLWKLQTLVIYGPWMPSVGGQLHKLPTAHFDYWKMPWLRNVSFRVPSCFRYCQLPQRLRDGYPVPSNLQTLSTISFSSCKAEVLFLMPKLKKLGVYETKEDIENGEYIRCFQNLPSLTELETLKFTFYQASEAARSLPLDVLPVSLKKLTLSGSCLPWDNMDLLAVLPQLETLKLKNYAFKGALWELTDVVFGHLKYLLIDNADLGHWEAEGTVNFPCLKRLVLRSCRSLYDIPFEAFPVLEQIDVHNCSHSAEYSAKRFQEQYGFPEIIDTNRTRVMEKGGQAFEFEY